MIGNNKKTLTFLWCIPRSISTAFEKMMSCSRQFKVVGEPFIDLYKRSLLLANDPLTMQQKFEDVCEELLTQSMTEPVFVKDMAYHAYPFITDNFIQSVNNTFLIRDPRLSIPSLYKMRANFAEAETGFEGQYKLFQRIQDVTGRTPYVLDGERLKQSADLIISDYFKYIGQKMPRDILSWQAGSRDDWVGRESWHIEAINSQGYEKSDNKINIKEMPQKVIESIERNMYFYQQMYMQISTQIN